MRRPGLLGRRCAAASLTPAATALATDELHVLAHDTESLAFLPSLLVVPLVELQAALDKDRAAFREILRRAAAGRVSDDDASGPGGDAGVIGRPGKRRAEHATLPAGAGGNRAKRARDW